jgi:mono/diheme cytochrome c family protein
MTMTTKKAGVSGWRRVGVAAVCALAAACGSSGVTGSAVTGLAMTDGPVNGTVSLADSSANVQHRSVSTRSDGTFSFDVANLTPPYLLKVEYQDTAGPGALYAVSEDNEALDVNPLTDVAFASAAGDRAVEQVFRESESDQNRTTASRANALLVTLKSVLAPLFARYGITDPRTDRAAVTLLLADIRITRDDGRVRVTNRATGGVIFVGRLTDLSAGTFTAANMPPGPSTTPPPSTDGAALYAANCQSCHGALASSQVRGGSASAISAAISANKGGMGSLASLTSAQLAAIASALSGPTGGGTCSAFTYSAWSTCSAAGTQTRAVQSSSPAGCTGGSPVTTQACTPPTSGACTYTYAGWGACQPDNSQTRLVLTATPAGCSGTPVTTQACVYVPPVTACTSFNYSTWGTCSAAGSQSRTVTASMPAGCTGGSPVTTQACTPPVVLDGAALYTQYCSGCHGNSKKGSSASNIASAIASNRGGMGSLSSLTAAQLAAIAAAP